MFGRGVALVLGALLLCSCQTTERQGLDYAALTQKVGRPKAGRISSGSWADLVFVDGDPLRDLAVLQKPKAVWVRGAPVG